MALPPVLGRLRGRRLLLASASPRRRDILEAAGLHFQVAPSGFPETLDPASFPAPADYAAETARRKALDAALQMWRSERRTPDVVIGADTIVVLDDVILGKPRDPDDACRMLRRLSGRTHSVITGVALLLFDPGDPGGDPGSSAPPPGSSAPPPAVTHTFHEETRVTFSALTEALVREYVHTGEPMDKAGGYGLQTPRGATLVQRVEGDFFNAVGFPLNRFCRELAAVLLPEAEAAPEGTTPGALRGHAPAGEEEGAGPRESVDRGWAQLSSGVGVTG